MREGSTSDRARKLAAISAASRHSFPTGDIDQLLDEIDRGRGSARGSTLGPVPRTLHLEAFAGRWVALDADDAVQRDAATLAELLQVVERDGLRDVEVIRAPLADEPIVYGLG